MTDRQRAEAEWTHVTDSATERAHGCLWGALIGDALAMPVHGYYDRAALHRDYGVVSEYVAPRNPHPESVLPQSTYHAPNPHGEILHEQAKYWGRPGVHPHQFLQPGENTLDLKLAAVLMESLAARGGYDADDYVKRYIDFLRTPGRHSDTFIEDCHCAFFTNLANGVPARLCAVRDLHLGGLAGVPVLAVYFRGRPEAAVDAVRTHVGLTHCAPETMDVAESFARLLLRVLDGDDLQDAVRQTADAPGGLGAGKLVRLLEQPSETVVGGVFGVGGLVAEAWPAVLFLALKYAGRFERGLVVNANLGGDSCHRGALLGALLGAEAGKRQLPGRWVEGLKELGRLQNLVNAVMR